MLEFNVPEGQRIQRKQLITVAEWTGEARQVYVLQTSQPADWASNFDAYYTKNASGQYVAVTGDTAPSWAANTYYTKTTSTLYREILGTRTEDSSIEFNADIETTTDVRGITYTDVNKTEPQQDFDPYNLLGGSPLGAYLTTHALKNNIVAYNNVFNVYIITAFIGSQADGYFTVMHSGCSIIPQSLGGDAYNNMPIEVHLSNNITEGTVDSIGKDFTFTPASTTTTTTT